MPWRGWNAAFALLFCTLGTEAANAQSIEPPSATVEVVVDDYFGLKVHDPYRWMEDGPANPAFRDFLTIQNNHTRAMLDALGGAREKLRARIRELNNAAASVHRWQRAWTSIFFLETAPGRNVASLRVREASGHVRTLLDPTQLATHGTHASIDYFVPSPDGGYVALGISTAGSENSIIGVIDVRTGLLLPDWIDRARFGSPSWRADSRSFYYSRLQPLGPHDPPTAIYENQRVYVHTIGRDVGQDTAVFGHGVAADVELPKSGFVRVQSVPGSRYALAYHTAGTTDSPSAYVSSHREADDRPARWRKVISPSDRVSSVAAAPFALRGSQLYVILSGGAQHDTVVRLDLDDPGVARRDVLDQSTSTALVGIYTASDALYVVSRSGLRFELQRLPYGADAAKIEHIPMPYPGTISDVSASPQLPGILFRLDSWVQSPKILSYDPRTQRVADTNLAVPFPGTGWRAIEAQLITVPSADGTAIPVSIIRPRNAALNGSHRVYLEGYGAYGLSLDPGFQAARLAWLERGGIYAIAHIRGGGEYGQRWHRAGQKATKQNSIDDLVAAARYLIEKRYTSATRLAVRGSSAGAIAMGGAVNQQPKLFAVAINNVGATDLLRLFTTSSGTPNIPELGDIRNRGEFPFIFKVSAYHHVRDGAAYPAFMGMTGANDPRVPSWMVAKMTARVRAATSTHRPVLLRVDFDAGHAGARRDQREAQLADELSFILWQTGDPAFQPSKIAPAD